MIQKLIDNYQDFHDALITEINYFNGYNFQEDSSEETNLKITISCFNVKRNYERDLIIIYCESVNSFIYEKWDGMIFEAEIKEENGEITLDFSKENIRDYFLVKCKKLTYKIINQK